MCTFKERRCYRNSEKMFHMVFESVTQGCGCLNECEFIKYGVQVEHTTGCVFCIFMHALNLN